MSLASRARLRATDDDTDALLNETNTEAALGVADTEAALGVAERTGCSELASVLRKRSVSGSSSSTIYCGYMRFDLYRTWTTDASSAAPDTNGPCGPARTESYLGLASPCH